MKSNWFHRFLHLRFYLVINTFVPNLFLFDDLLKLLWENAGRTYIILFWSTKLRQMAVLIVMDKTYFSQMLILSG